MKCLIMLSLDLHFVSEVQGSNGACSRILVPQLLSGPTSFHLPKMGSQGPSPQLPGTPHTSQSPTPLPHNGCHPLLLAGAWAQHREGRDELWAPPSPGLLAPPLICWTADQTLHLSERKGEPFLTPHPDPEHIPALRLTDPWRSPICWGCGWQLQLPWAPSRCSLFPGLGGWPEQQLVTVRCRLASHQAAVRVSIHPTSNSLLCPGESSVLPPCLSKACICVFWPPGGRKFPLPFYIVFLYLHLKLALHNIKLKRKFYAKHLISVFFFT